MKQNKDDQTPRSRRERPAKPALTRQGIIDVALSILRDEGLNKVTMRRVAEALDTGPASLYVYVRNTTDLHAQILDALLAAVTQEFPAEGTWRERMKQVLMHYIQVLYEYPEIARMTLITHLSGPNYLALVDYILSLLQEGGMSDREAAWAVDLLLLYATAVTVEHSTRESSATGAEEEASFVTTITTVDASRYPHIARLSDELFSGRGERFQWAIDVLLTGALHFPHAGPERENT